MRAVLLSLALLTVSADALAVGAVWERKRVVVFDHTSEAMRPLVRQTVAEMNRISPKAAPRLKYRPQASERCRTRKTGITVCERDVGGGGVSIAAQKRHVIRNARILIVPEQSDPKASMCHEFMHALFGAPEFRERNKLRTCLGALQSPGPWDRTWAKRVYRKHGR